MKPGPELCVSQGIVVSFQASFPTIKSHKNSPRDSFNCAPPPAPWNWHPFCTLHATYLRKEARRLSNFTLTEQDVRFDLLETYASVESRLLVWVPSACHSTEGNEAWSEAACSTRQKLRSNRHSPRRSRTLLQPAGAKRIISLQSHQLLHQRLQVMVDAARLEFVENRPKNQQSLVTATPYLFQHTTLQGTTTLQGIWQAPQTTNTLASSSVTTDLLRRLTLG